LMRDYIRLLERERILRPVKDDLFRHTGYAVTRDDFGACSHPFVRGPGP